jgi:hypothetical protein
MCQQQKNVRRLMPHTNRGQKFFFLPPFATLLGFIFAHPFGNCWRPLGFRDPFLPQLFRFVLHLYALNLLIFMARVPLPPHLIAENASLSLAMGWRKKRMLNRLVPLPLGECLEMYEIKCASTNTLLF